MAEHICHPALLAHTTPDRPSVQSNSRTIVATAPVLGLLLAIHLSPFARFEAPFHEPPPIGPFLRGVPHVIVAMAAVVDPKTSGSAIH